MILSSAERIREFKARGWWGEQTLVNLFEMNVRTRPETEALVDPPNLALLSDLPSQRLSWRQIEHAVRERAALLHAHGVAKDDIILVQLPNSVELTLAYLACLRLGAIISPAPAQYRAHELAGIVRRVGAVAAITTGRIGSYSPAETIVPLMAEHPTLRSVFSLGSAPPGTIGVENALASLSLQALLEADRAASEVNATADDIVTVCWTSGTEAEPKGVPRSHNEWIIVGQGTVSAARLEPGIRLLNPFPMVNMAGLATAFTTWLLTGGVLVQHHPFDLPVFLQQIRDEEIAYTVAPPVVLNTLLNNEHLVQGIDFERLNRIGSGSAPLSDWMMRTFRERHGVEIIYYFGSNEGACFAGCADDIPDPAERAVYFPRLGDERFKWRYELADRLFVRVVDSDDHEEILQPGRVGELRVKGPTIFSGYWKAPEVTKRAFDADGWFRTGDLFEIAGADGRYLKFVGRLKDIIIRGGVNISAEELELHLLSHPKVTDVAVVGSPDRDMGERLCACIVTKDDVALAELNHFLVEEKKLAVFKQIERLIKMDALPRNAVGKVLKRELREMVAAGTK